MDPMSVETEPLQPASGLEILERLAHRARDAVRALLGRSAVRYEDINADGGLVFIGWNVWQWESLSDEAQPIAGAARRAHDDLVAFARVVFTAGAPDRIAAVEQLSDWLLRLVEQPNGSLPHGAPSGDVNEIAANVGSRIDDFLGEAAKLPTAHGKDERLLVADTSALLDRPLMQDWKIDGGPWTVVLVPQVLAELDDKKRDPRVLMPPPKSFDNSTSSTAAATPSSGCSWPAASVCVK